VRLLIDAGADLAATGLDGGTALHQAAWFGQPENARLLIAAGAPLGIFDETHDSSPLGWAVHGSRYSGDAETRQDAYVELVVLLLDAGSGLKDEAYLQRLRNDASPRVAALLPRAL
jgi:ankyrin repeat protein